MKQRLLAGICLMLLLTGCGPAKEPEPADEGMAQEELWELISLDERYQWSSGEYAVTFRHNGTVCYFSQYPLSAEDIPEAVRVTGFEYLGAGVYSFTAALSAGTEKDYTLEFADDSRKRIRVKTYLADGADQVQTYRIVEVQEETPAEPEQPEQPETPQDVTLSQLWEELALADSWTSSDEQFVRFYSDGTRYQLDKGVWNGGGRFAGTVSGFTALGASRFQFTVSWPQTETQQASDDTVILQWSAAAKDQVILTVSDGAAVTYIRDTNSQLDQKTLWTQLSGSWTALATGDNTVFTLKEDGTFRLRYQKEGKDPYEGTAADYHTGHYEYVMTVIFDDAGQKDMVLDITYYWGSDVIFINGVQFNKDKG